MKLEILKEIFRELKTRPDLMRKIKMIAIFGLIGLVLTAALTIWVGITAFDYVATKATAVYESPVAQDQVKDLKTNIEKLPQQLNMSNCMNKFQSLIAVQPWLEGTIADNLISLKAACLKDTSAILTSVQTKELS